LGASVSTSKRRRICAKPTGSTPRCAAEIEIAFDGNRAGPDGNVERGRHRLQRDTGAGYQRLEQHIPGTEFKAGAVAEWSPATASARPVATLQAICASSRLPFAVRVMYADSGSLL
jgi:hypothetical protein